MTFIPVATDPFEDYFYKRAQMADDMASSGCVVDAYTLATASLDALAAIWFNDLPDVALRDLPWYLSTSSIVRIR